MDSDILHGPGVLLRIVENIRLRRLRNPDTPAQEAMADSFWRAVRQRQRRQLQASWERQLNKLEDDQDSPRDQIIVYDFTS